MFDVLGIDILDVAEMVGPYLTSAGGLGGLLWKQSRDKKHIVKEFSDKYMKSRELDEKEQERKERHRKDAEARIERFDQDLNKYAVKEMNSIKDDAYLFCLDAVNNLIRDGHTQVERVVDDEVFMLSLTEKAMSKFKEALGDTLVLSIKEINNFVDFETISAYDGVSYYHAINEKIEDISRVWMNTLKMTGMVEVYRFALETAIKEKVQRSVERIYSRCLSKSDNQNQDLIIAFYRRNTMTLEPIGDVIEERIEDPIINDSPFSDEWE